MFTEQEAEACRRLVELALQEDLNEIGDITSQATIPNDALGKAVFFARAEGTLAGNGAVALVCQAVDERLCFEPLIDDGSQLRPGDRIATLRGPQRSLLAAERTALNFMQRLSGVATMSRRFVDAVAGLPCQILDTRKTTPGWRLLEKYAVRCGGAFNHRIGLFDGVLVKDNHLAALGGGLPAISLAVTKARAQAPSSMPIEIEVENLEQLDAALASTPDIILLDNMNLNQLREAVQRRTALAPGVKLEASGGVNLSTVRAIAETGVDRISVGALTHSAPALDIALDFGA